MKTVFCTIYVHSCGEIVKKTELDDFDFDIIKELYKKAKEEYGDKPSFCFDLMIGCR